MHRKPYLASLFVSIALAVVASLAFLINPVADFIERVAWPQYQPDHHELAALGFVDQQREIPARWQQFRAFIERARGHSHNIGGTLY